MIKYTKTPNAPAAIGPYSQAIAYNGLLYISGMIPLDPISNEIVQNDIVTQTTQVIKNIEAILNVNNISFEDILKTTCMLDNMDLFVEFNEVYAKYFVSNPARSTFAVKGLPKGVLCEIDVIAKV